MSGARIAERLQREFGVVFREAVPTRAHYSRHGDLGDIFLVTERVMGRGRVILSTQIPWEWNGHRGIEIALQHEVPARKLAKARLELNVSDVFSGYGVGLYVSDADWKP